MGAEAAKPREIRPQPGPQTGFLATPADIAIYGGAAGGGKTWALLMEPLRHCANGDFGAVIFRRTTIMIRNEGGLWDESVKLYPLTGARAREHVLEWRFPSGAAVSMAHLEHDKNVLDYQGAQIPLICFDELTHFSAKQFWYMVSRNRSMCGVRPYIRATCNPDVDSWVAGFIAWWIDPETGLPIPERAGVLRWFVRINDLLIWANTAEELEALYPDTPPKSVTFIPAKLSDNVALMDVDPGYRANLMALPLVDRERLLGGNWKIKNTRTLVFENWRVEAFTAPAGVILRFGADWGFATDPTVLVRAYLDGRKLYVDYEAYAVGCDIDATPFLFAGAQQPEDFAGQRAELKADKFGGVPGAKAWKITADSARPETINYMRRKGFKIVAALKGPGSLEEGVEWLKSCELIVHPRCLNVINELGLYAYKTDPKTDEVLPLLEDRKNHTIDALRYAFESLRRAIKGKTPPPGRKSPTDYKSTQQGEASWKSV